jgi:hypothetical protein
MPTSVTTGAPRASAATPAARSSSTAATSTTKSTSAVAWTMRSVTARVSGGKWVVSTAARKRR